MRLAKKLIAVRRDDIYSPNSVDKDRLILQDVCRELMILCEQDEEVEMIDEADIATLVCVPDVCLSMARSPRTLSHLQELEHKGCLVFNSAHGVARCQRSVLDNLMRKHGIAMPPLQGDYGYWLKRGDTAAQNKEDILFCPTEDSVSKGLAAFRNRGIEDVVLSAHVPGDLIKFYGVGSRFFRYFYPSEDGIFKFGDELVNGAATYYSFDAARLQSEIYRLSALIGVDIYGGDAIIAPDGSFYIIDFNDWPSFSRCRADAAKAIAIHVMEELSHN